MAAQIVRQPKDRKKRDYTMTSLFCCPICGQPLEREGKSYICPKRHCYDVAKEGYVNLLPANKKHAKDPGDDKDMVAARTRFLEGGHYEPLRDALSALAVEEKPAAVLDSGCGEGWYTAGVCEALGRNGLTTRVAGVDLSRSALKKAARRAGEAEFAVASVYHLPVADHSVDLLINCFSPLAAEEFRRVLRPKGTFLYVVPGAKHLWELKQVLYEKPYENEEKQEEYTNFFCEKVVPVDFAMELDGAALQDLFRMTPYCWKTPKAGVERMNALDRLVVTASFRIHVFRAE